MTDEIKKLHPDHSSHHEKHHDAHDEHLMHQMDTNEFGNHANLHEIAEKRFHSAALAYCYHRVSGAHDTCIEEGLECPFDLGMFDAYRMLVNT